MYFGAPVIGWAKPTPVDPRNFKNPVLDDILTSVVGPISNFVVAIAAALILAVVKLVSPVGREIVSGILQGFITTDTNSFLVPLCLLLYELLVINVLLGVFNLIPVPPLDGSHVVRHLSARRSAPNLRRGRHVWPIHSGILGWSVSEHANLSRCRIF